MRRTRSWLIGSLLAAALLGLAASLVIYFGCYNVAADTPHAQIVYRLLEFVRDRSIAVRAKDLAIPSDLTDPQRISRGAGQYDEMCVGCHLAPGMKRTEIGRGLYPRAPDLRRSSRPTAAEDFWVVKHGIKMTGMPAWGVTHDDDLLWDVVAFLRKMPDLTSDEYQALVKSVPKTHQHMMQEGPAESGGENHQH
jgi:mono/diheme cytochrome c family protein